ncbi:MAG: Mini-ribonuclease 3 [Christensenellales bacterium]
MKHEQKHMHWLPAVNPVQEADMLSPPVLAYIGDTIYDLFIRIYLVTNHPENAHKLHVRAIGFVSAPAQACAVYALMDKLTEQEQAVFRRGRNAKTFTTPKNASVADYHAATGFEALLGWLYLKDESARLLEILHLALNEMTSKTKGEE